MDGVCAPLNQKTIMLGPWCRFNDAIIIIIVVIVNAIAILMIVT